MSSSHKHTETRKKADTKTHPTDQQAMKDFDTHGLEGASVDPVPLPDQGGHSHSHAAHVSGKPANTPMTRKMPSPNPRAIFARALTPPACANRPRTSPVSESSTAGSKSLMSI